MKIQKKKYEKPRILFSASTEEMKRIFVSVGIEKMGRVFDEVHRQEDILKKKMLENMYMRHQFTDGYGF